MNSRAGLPLDRFVGFLPCAYCGGMGPYGFRMQRAHGLTVICSRCRDSEVAEDPGENVGDGLHLESVSVQDASALVTAATGFQGREEEPKR